jgi:hypothetical protein
MVPGGGPPRPASPRGALGSCRSINHCELGARKPYGARLFGVFALVQIGFKFPFGELFGQKMPAVGRRQAASAARQVNGTLGPRHLCNP